MLQNHQYHHIVKMTRQLITSSNNCCHWTTTWTPKLGILGRRIVSEYPIRVEYEITDLGREFEPVLLAAASFSMKNMPNIGSRTANLEILVISW